MDELGAAIGFSDVGPCRSSPHTRGSRPFSLAGFLLTQEGAQKIVQRAHRLDRFDLKLLDLVPQDNRFIGRR
jgi:hypothetical protein